MKTKTTKHKKIVIDARFWGPSHTGLGRYTQSLVTALEKIKPNFNISLLVNQTQKTKFNQIKVKAKPYSIKEQFEIPKILNQLKPDLVHFLHFNVPLRVKQSFIVTIHDLIKHHSTGRATTTKSVLSYPVKRLAYFLTIKSSINKSQKILTPSNWVKKDILKHYSVNQAKIIVTPEAADKTYFHTKPSLNRPLKSPYLIYVGNAYPHKNLIQLIKAVQKTTLKLIIVTGRDIFYQRLRQTIRELKVQQVVKIKGFTSDKSLKSLYFHSTAFISTSLFEGFGLPGLEALASKTLVLASKRASMPEVYQKHAFYFNPDDLDNIVNQITQVTQLTPSQRQARLQAGLTHAQSFSWQKTAKATLKVYEDCLSLRSS